jgi:hypothetical protein
VSRRYNAVVTKARGYPPKYNGGVILSGTYWGGAWDEERVMEGACLCLWATGSLVAPEHRSGATLITISGVNNRYISGELFTGETIKNMLSAEAPCHIAWRQGPIALLLRPGPAGKASTDK